MLTRKGRPLRVLIVEDQALVALDLGLSAEELGAVVIGQARSGEDGIELARALSPDIVIMDVRLAGAIDGVDAAKAIAQLPGVALIFVTGNNDPATLARIRRAGNFIVVPKPVLAADLESALYAAGAIEPPTRACAARVWQVSALPRRARTAAKRQPARAVEGAGRRRRASKRASAADAAPRKAARPLRS